jgi:hypothetical protein
MKYKMAALFSITSLCCQALPVGNPSESQLLTSGVGPFEPFSCLNIPYADCINVRVGFYGDYVFQRNLEVYSLSGQSDTNSDLLHTKLFTNASYLSFAFNDYLEVFGTLGATSIFLDSDSKSFALGWIYPEDPIDLNPFGGTLTIQSADAFSWSVGARALLYEYRCLALGLEGQYFQTRPLIEVLEAINTVEAVNTEPGFRGLIHADTLLNMKYIEWQVGLGASCNIGVFSPYAAIKLSSAKLYMDNAKLGFSSVSGYYPILGDCRSSKKWGYAIGFSVTSLQTLALTMEGRFGDETALYANGQFRF